MTFSEKWLSNAKQSLNPPVAPHLNAGVTAPCCVVTMSLVLSDSDGCSAVLYEALDDSPDDMYLDWFQGQLCPSEGPGLVGPACLTLHILPPLHMVSANRCPAVSLLFFVVSHLHLILSLSLFSTLEYI